MDHLLTFILLTLSILKLTLASFGNVATVALETHNNLRRRHQAPPLEWDSELAKLAQQVANNLVATQSLRSSRLEDTAENIAGFTGRNNETEMTINGIMDWYSEIKNYDWMNPEKNLINGVSHFCQIVWNSTQFLGFGIATDSTTGMSVVVAEYKPRGNIEGLFQANVREVKNEMRRSRELK